MERMIDGDKLVKNLRLIATCWSISPFVSKEKHNGAVNMLREVEREVKEAPTLTPPNEPLTLEQIKSLYDSPAWYQDLYRKMGYWIIVGVIGEIGVHLTDLDNANEFYSTIDYGARWALFRRPPEGGDADHA